ncbi:hypothetical protein [Piscibacillus sp. B03]
MTGRELRITPNEQKKIWRGEEVPPEGESKTNCQPRAKTVKQSDKL